MSNKISNKVHNWKISAARSLFSLETWQTKIPSCKIQLEKVDFSGSSVTNLWSISWILSKIFTYLHFAHLYIKIRKTSRKLLKKNRFLEFFSTLKNRLAVVMRKKKMNLASNLEFLKILNARLSVEKHQ